MPSRPILPPSASALLPALLPALLVLASAWRPAPAAAQQPDHPWVTPSKPVPTDRRTPWERSPFAAELHAGFGTPVGLLGLVLDYSATDWLSFSAGAGVGSGHEDSNHLHTALGTRLRFPPMGRGRLYLGADYATGSWQKFSPSIGTGHSSVDREIYADRMHWIQPAFGYERRSDSVFRLYGGLALPLTPGAIRCAEVSNIASASERETPCAVSDDERSSAMLIFMGVAFGFAFPN